MLVVCDIKTSFSVDKSKPIVFPYMERWFTCTLRSGQVVTLDYSKIDYIQIYDTGCDEFKDYHSLDRGQFLARQVYEYVIPKSLLYFCKYFDSWDSFTMFFDGFRKGYNIGYFDSYKVYCGGLSYHVCCKEQDFYKSLAKFALV